MALKEDRYHEEGGLTQDHQDLHKAQCGQQPIHNNPPDFPIGLDGLFDKSELILILRESR